MEYLISSIKKQLSNFDKSVFVDIELLKEGIYIALYWIIPSFIFVGLTKNYIDYLPEKYFEQAISEGIGVHLWNVMGTFGFIFFGMFILFPRISFFSKSSYHIFINTYAIGCLSLGLIAGNFFFLFSDAVIEYSIFRKVLAGTSSIIMIFYVFLLNYSLFYLSQLMVVRNRKKDFIDVIGTLKLPLRFFCFIFFVLIPIYFLSFEN